MEGEAFLTSDRREEGKMCTESALSFVIAIA